MTDVRPEAARAAQSAPPGTPPPYNVLSIVALVGAFVVPVAGIVCGHIALAQIRRTGEQGHGLALAGTILGWVLTGFIALFVIVWFGFFLTFLATFATFAQHIPSATPVTG